LLDGLQPPVLGFQDQQAAPGVNDHEVGLRLLGSEGHVVPKQLVVVQFFSKRSARRRSPLVMRVAQKQEATPSTRGAGQFSVVDESPSNRETPNAPTTAAIGGARTSR
jgi:hypothetical protein